MVSNTSGYQLTNIGESWRKKKRLYAQFTHESKPDIIVHFGYNGGRTYIDRDDYLSNYKTDDLLTVKEWNTIRDNYINRHRVNESRLWTNPFKPATLARYILWGSSTDIDDNITSYKQLFNI